MILVSFYSEAMVIEPIGTGMILVSFYSEAIDQIENERNIVSSNLHKIARAKFRTILLP